MAGVALNSGSTFSKAPPLLLLLLLLLLPPRQARLSPATLPRAGGLKTMS